MTGVQRAPHQAAAAVGQELVTSSAAAGGAEGTPGGLMALLDGLGFEPYDDDGTVRLRSCPFHALAQQRTDLVCG